MILLNKTIILLWHFLLTVAIFDDLSNSNKLILVDPDHLTHHNPLEPLYIRLTLLREVVGLAVYLQRIGGDRLSPEVLKVLDPPNKIIIKFSTEYLVAGSCYELVVEGVVVTDGRRHSFCMSDCMCNPKSNAICTQALSCICPEPYSGLTCYECMNGYFLQHSQCIQLVQTPVQFQQSSEDNKAENAPAQTIICEEGFENNGDSCKLQTNNDKFAFKDTVIYCASYLIMGIIVLYLIWMIRKRTSLENKGFEMVPKEKEHLESY